jgi:hypothetical protein
MSFRVEVEEEGVMTGDWVESFEAFGDAVPSFASLFFLDLLSLPRDSCIMNQSVACSELSGLAAKQPDLRLWRRNASSL